MSEERLFSAIDVFNAAVMETCTPENVLSVTDLCTIGNFLKTTTLSGVCVDPSLLEKRMNSMEGDSIRAAWRQVCVEYRALRLQVTSC